MMISALKLFTKTQEQWNTFQTPASDIERNATHNFAVAGLGSNRFVAAYQAIGAIAASGIMVIGNPVTGIIKGAVNLSQGRVSQGISEAACGVFNSSRSLYNILFVFTTAIAGLFFNEIMYKKTMSRYLSQPESLKLRIGQLQSEVQRLQTQKNNIEFALRNGAELLTKDFKPDFSKLKEGAEKAQNSLKQLLQEIGAVKDPKLSNEYIEQTKKLEAAQKEQKEAQNTIEKLTTRYTEELDTLNKKHVLAQNGSDKKIEDLTEEHAQALKQLQDEHEKALGEAQKTLEESNKKSTEAESKVKELMQQLATEQKEAQSKIQKLNQEHEGKIQILKEEHLSALVKASDPAQNGSEKKVKELTEQHEQVIQKLKIEHEKTLRKLSEAENKFKKIENNQKAIEAFRALLLKNPDELTKTFRSALPEDVKPFVSIVWAYKTFCEIRATDDTKLLTLKVNQDLNTEPFTLLSKILTILSNLKKANELAESHQKTLLLKEQRITTLTNEKEVMKQDLEQETNENLKLKTEIEELKNQIAQK